MGFKAKPSQGQFRIAKQDFLPRLEANAKNPSPHFTTDRRPPESVAARARLRFHAKSFVSPTPNRSYRVVSPSIATPRSPLSLLLLRRVARPQLYGRALLSLSNLGLPSRRILPRFAAYVTRLPSLKQDQRHQTGSRCVKRVSSHQDER